MIGDIYKKNFMLLNLIIKERISSLIVTNKN